MNLLSKMTIQDLLYRAQTLHQNNMALKTNLDTMSKIIMQDPIDDSDPESSIVQGYMLSLQEAEEEPDR